MASTVLAWEGVELGAAQAQGETVQAETEPAGTGAPLEPRPGDEVQPSAPGPGAGAPDRPPVLRFEPPPQAQPPPPVDAYSLRLVSGHPRYDDGLMVQRSPSLAQLVAPAALRINPHDLHQLGMASGEQVRMTSSRGSLVAQAVPDHGIPRGSASLPFNLQGPGAADLIDAHQPVTEVRLESVGGSQ